MTEYSAEDRRVLLNSPLGCYPYHPDMDAVRERMKRWREAAGRSETERRLAEKAAAGVLYHAREPSLLVGRESEADDWCVRQYAASWAHEMARYDAEAEAYLRRYAAAQVDVNG